MEPNYKGFVLDPEKCSGLPLEEKRQLVREVAQWSDDAIEILRSFSRKELLEMICAEMGKERKYSGFTKHRMIEHLLKLISTNSKRKSADDALDLSLAKSQTGDKKQRKNDDFVQLPYQDHVPGVSVTNDELKTVICRNLACKAALSSDDAFCKRCSCCVCHHYDENKDPSLWLTCESDLSSGDDSCGLSCHLKCALKHGRTGIAKNSKCEKLDGKFYCVCCTKVNNLMSTWRKQLLVAKVARRVDVLCLRISLCHKILDGTEKYKDLHKLIVTAAKKLRKELGPLDRVCERMGRSIVNRLACGAEVQKLCASALEAFEAIFSRPYTCSMTQKSSSTCRIRFEKLFPTSIVVVLEYDDQHFEEFLGCRIWHRKSSLKEYAEKPTCIVLRPEKKFKIDDLKPSTEYMCKVSLFSCTRIFGTWEAIWATPPSIADEQDAVIDESPRQLFRALIDCSKSAISNNSAKLRSLDDINAAHIVSTESIPATPSKVDARLGLLGLNNVRHQELNSNYEYCVRVIKSLERHGYLSVEFRVKLLTWFSLKATMQNRRVVSAFVDAMGDDPPSLAEQLIDAFADEICSDRNTCPSRILP